MANDAYKSALILGLGSSGEAAARLLLAEKAKIRIVDENKNGEIQRRSELLQRLGAQVAVGTAEIPPGDYDVCIVSPGLKAASPLLKEVKARGIPLLPEFELGWSRFKGKVLAITGSNGKSTLVKLCAEAMQQSGLTAFPAGNYGPPVSEVALEHPEAEWLVIEVSSFQLEEMRKFRPRVAVLLNILPNHLDRHHDMRSYTVLKMRLFENMAVGDNAVIHEDISGDMLVNGKMSSYSFGLSSASDYFFRDHAVWLKAAGRRISFENTLFDNAILGQAAAAAVAALEACGVDPACLETTAKNFQPLPHRMEFLGEINGVKFIDDSKATNAAALIGALKMLPEKVRLIAGGLPKHEPYESVGGLLADKVSAVYLIGQAALEMEAAWRNRTVCKICGTLERAFREACEDAVAGDIILLSPACASFDQFRNFEARGDRFREAFDLLKRQEYLLKNEA